MGSAFKLLLLSSLFIGVRANAASGDCPPHEPGSYPWQIDEVMSGDQWARVYVDIDDNGRPTQCRMGENNIHDPDTRFFACKTIKEDWYPVGDVKSMTVKRFFNIYGSAHVRANEKARKRYLAEHPEVRPSCYPE